jgi:hypothetical protein
MAASCHNLPATRGGFLGYINGAHKDGFLELNISNKCYGTEAGTHAMQNITSGCHDLMGEVLRQEYCTAQFYRKA